MMNSICSRYRCRGGPVLIALVTVLLILVGGFVATQFFLNRLFGTWTEPADISTVSKWTGIKFPSNSKLQHSLAINHGTDYELYAEVEICRRDVEPLVSELKRQSLKLSRKDRMHLSNSTRNFRKDTPIPEWWRPDSAQIFIACDIVPHIILISLDNPMTSTIWIHCDTDGPPQD